jgi:CRISPR-associated endonuclease Cas1
VNARRIVHEGPVLTPEDVADGAGRRAEAYSRRTYGGVCVADGFGIKVAVDRGALVVEDGIGEHRPNRRFDKATHGLRRLVVAGTPTGYATLESLAWCRRLEIPVVVLGGDGTPTLASTPRTTDDARLRRAQALAPDQPVGLGIARELLRAKLLGQVRLVGKPFGDQTTADTIESLASEIAVAQSIEECRQLEATAAALYWQAWAGRSECVPVFAARDLRRIPPHWIRFDGRRSVLASANANRKAERPTNAIVNYLSALLEAEAILACGVVGLDPGLGIVHNDAKGRQSFSLDLIEPVRPEAEGFVLDLLASRTFRKAEFTETADGHCRLLAPLTHELAETMPRWARLVAPYAERVAHMLGQAMAGKYQATTPLTTRRHRDAQTSVKARKAATKAVASSAAKRQRPGRRNTSPLWSCPECGGEVSGPRRVRCEKCIDADLCQSPELRQNRRAAISSRKRAFSEWDEAHPDTPYDPAYFRREILPRLGQVKLAAIMEAGDMSKSFASTVRRGIYAPHVSTWPALARLVKSPPPESRGDKYNK